MVEIETDAVCSRIAPVLKDVPDIAGAYLFCSALQRKVRPDSDIDIGLVPEKDNLPARQADLLESKAGNILQQFYGHPFDVVMLDMSVILSFREPCGSGIPKGIPGKGIEDYKKRIK